VQDVRANEAACGFTATFPADPAGMSVVVDRVAQELGERQWREDDVFAVQMALTEAVANAIRHGCGGDISKRVECSVDYGEVDEVVIVVRDPGGGFDPGSVPDPLDPASTLRPSGRGIFLMRVLMDHVVFTNGGREVQMRKRKASEREGEARR
jgi:serine/threonine-protein kinase RsbW